MMLVLLIKHKQNQIMNTKINVLSRSAPVDRP